MAWENTNARLQSSRDATNLPQLFRAVYEQAKVIQTALAHYQSQTDSVFNNAVNALLTAQERAELNVMAQQINALVTDWEQNHSGAISGA